MNGQIGLAAIHRCHLRVSTGDTTNLSRFVLPEDFIVALLSVELEFVRKGTKSVQVDAVAFAQPLRSKYMDQVMKVGQRVTFEYLGNYYIFRVNQAVVEGQKCSNNIEGGMMSKETNIVFEASHSSGIKIINQCEAASSNIFRHKEFNLKSLGIGGLSAEFADIF
ncbi:hypothetical protein Nepgr_007487 [Nepenthes gracilis]|uniref:Vesicle-fusing ATPase n=1 Tax=Nepenthes gracilis TaxID=150966 RepID=A0AAD3S704_NEPGR|nr:hypothetical protein Nepgr_007487 [Nepenthes gracilis]